MRTQLRSPLYSGEPNAGAHAHGDSSAADPTSVVAGPTGLPYSTRGILTCGILPYLLFSIMIEAGVCGIREGSGIDESDPCGIRVGSEIT